MAERSVQSLVGVGHLVHGDLGLLGFLAVEDLLREVVLELVEQIAVAGWLVLRVVGLLVLGRVECEFDLVGVVELMPVFVLLMAWTYRAIRM